MRKGGDHPTLNGIDNDIASHGIAATTPFGITKNHRTIRAELTVLFRPFQLYEFAVIRTQRTRAKRWFVLEIALRLIKRMELPASRCAVETSRNSRSAPETGIAKHRECGKELDVHSQSQARLSESASSTPLLLTIPEVVDQLRVDKHTVYRAQANSTCQSSVWVPAHACDVSTWSNIWLDSRPTRRKPQRPGVSARRCCYDHGNACRPPGDER